MRRLEAGRGETSTGRATLGSGHHGTHVHTRPPPRSHPHPHGTRDLFTRAAVRVQQRAHACSDGEFTARGDRRRFRTQKRPSGSCSGAWDPKSFPLPQSHVTGSPQDALSWLLHSADASATWWRWHCPGYPVPGIHPTFSFIPAVLMDVWVASKVGQW